MEGREEMTGGAEQVPGEKGDTWPKVLRHNSERYGDTRKAMRYKHYGVWQPSTWKDYYDQVKTLALGLMALGISPEDKVLIIGDNAPQWYYAALAAQAVRGISVGVYADLLPEEIKKLAEDCQARYAVVEDQEQVDKLLQIKDQLPWLEKVVYWNTKGLAHYNDPILLGYGQVGKLGQAFEKEHPGLFEQKVAEGLADDVCALVYTSGTTMAAPRAAMHTFRTMKAAADRYLYLDPWEEKDNVVPYLPPVWMSEQALGIGCHLLSGCCLNFAEGPETLKRDIRETGPSIVFYNARLWESQAAAVQARILGVGALKKWAFARLMPVGYKMAEGKLQKKSPGLFFKMGYILADRILLGRMRTSLGLANARICYSLGAILSPEALRFYQALNLPVKSLYGTTEAGPLSGAKNDDLNPDTVGSLLQGVEIKISDRGELAFRHPGLCLGYYQDPEKTAEVFKEGWFYSGDSGYLREDGHLVFIDRLHDLVALKSGQKLAPQLVESRLRFSPFIKEAWVLAGPDKAYASAVIVIDYTNVGQWAGQRKIAFSTLAELSQKPEVYALVKNDIDRVNQTLPSGSRMMKYVHLHKEFNPDEDELTRTMNLRRTVLEKHYRELIEALYTDKTEAQIETPVKHRDGQTGTIKTILRIMSAERTGV